MCGVGSMLYAECDWGSLRCATREYMCATGIENSRMACVRGVHTRIYLVRGITKGALVRPYARMVSLGGCFFFSTRISLYTISNVTYKLYTRKSH